MQRVLQLLHESTGNDYSTYYADVRTELHKLFAKYERKFGAARSQRVTQPANHTGKKKQPWGRIFGGSGVVGSTPATSSSSSHSTASELACYLNSGCITSYEDYFDILL
jgi:hypothetical protein